MYIIKDKKIMGYEYLCIEINKDNEDAIKHILMSRNSDKERNKDIQIVSGLLWWTNIQYKNGVETKKDQRQADIGDYLIHVMGEKEEKEADFTTITKEEFKEEYNVITDLEYAIDNHAFVFIAKRIELSKY